MTGSEDREGKRFKMAAPLAITQQNITLIYTGEGRGESTVKAVTKNKTLRRFTLLKSSQSRRNKTVNKIQLRIKNVINC